MAGMPLFHKEIHTEGGGFIDSQCVVSADPDGYFVSVITDDYEGAAMMTLPCAIKVHRALGQAIRAARRKRQLVSDPSPERTPEASRE